MSEGRQQHKQALSCVITSGRSGKTRICFNHFPISLLSDLSRQAFFMSERNQHQGQSSLVGFAEQTHRPPTPSRLSNAMRVL